jgi:hypothetical protein
LCDTNSNQANPTQLATALISSWLQSLVSIVNEETLSAFFLRTLSLCCAWSLPAGAFILAGEQLEKLPSNARNIVDQSEAWKSVGHRIITVVKFRLHCGSR